MDIGADRMDRVRDMDRTVPDPSAQSASGATGTPMPAWFGLHLWARVRCAPKTTDGTRTLLRYQGDMTGRGGRASRTVNREVRLRSPEGAKPPMRKGPAFDRKAGPYYVIAMAQAPAWALAISFLIFSAAGERSSSLALARYASRPPR